ncbi:Kinesin-like protein kif7 [Labeo rohita]|uniref:Kinesin-like protein kif7 n=1 Tax=Labeo rohita TaxID=84645 RepID=A0ABQ8LME3_LABRO|nr:Kinesin-like protein kif7 [Labeo rohita]
MKHKNILQKANRKKAEARLTGGGPPPPPLTPSEELALSLNKGRPVVDGIPGGTSSHTPCTTSNMDEDDEDDDEETTSAVTEVDNAGRSTEYIPGDLPTDEGPSTSMHNLSSLPAKELYKVHLQKQIRKSDMEMDLIQLQMEEKRLSIKKATLEIELLEHRLKGFLWAIFFNTRRVALSSYSGNVVKYNTSHYDVACPLWTDPEPTQTLKPRLEDPYGHLHLGPCSAVSQVKACLWSRIRIVIKRARHAQ